MNLAEAFGSNYFIEPKSKQKTKTLGSAVEETITNTTAPETIVTQSSPETIVTQRSPETIVTQNSPEVYLLHVEIGREDCHLLCMFLLVFTISFLLSSRK